MFKLLTFLHLLHLVATPYMAGQLFKSRSLPCVGGTMAVDDLCDIIVFDLSRNASMPTNFRRIYPGN